jgi:branched-chain amino acid transport system ATP-binding protein
MLKLHDIHTYYGDSHILQGVSLEVKNEEAVALLGRNGVGKTTTISSIIGFEPPRRGEITLEGKQISGLSSYEIAQRGVGLVPQGRGIFPTLTVKENLTIAARDAKNGGWTLDRLFPLFPNLRDRLGNYGRQLSGGEQQMLAMARALMTNPKLLLLDEPSEGLAPLIVKEIGNIVKEVKKSGMSILLVEQNLSMALEVVDRVYVMSKGRIEFEGTPAALKAEKELMLHLLGV